VQCTSAQTEEIARRCRHAIARGGLIDRLESAVDVIMVNKANLLEVCAHNVIFFSVGLCYGVSYSTAALLDRS
jgi:hypothetical protein